LKNSTTIEIERAERHIRALALAKECAILGARLRTISYITGLTHRELSRLLFAHGQSIPCGRHPDSPDWYHSANLLNRTEASIFVSIYRRIRDLGFGPADALVSGYRHYQTSCHQQPRVSFDRAFDLASHIDGLWLARKSNFSLLNCPVCASQYVAAVSVHPVSNHECPFCKLVSRYQRDPRIQSSFPVRDLPDVSSLQLGMVALPRRSEK
jgi:flagellar transcriptional activator FlhC